MPNPSNDISMKLFCVILLSIRLDVENVLKLFRSIILIEDLHVENLLKLFHDILSQFHEVRETSTKYLHTYIMRHTRSCSRSSR